MKKVAILLIALLTVPAFSANVLKQAREALKKRSNLEQTAQSLLQEALKPATKHADRIECYQLAAECAQRVNDIENEKLYLKKSYDTVKFFSSIHDVYVRTLLADSVAALPDEKGKVRQAYRKKNHDVLQQYRANLLAGANWFYRHGQMDKAYPLFDTYIGVAAHPLFAADDLEHTDSLLPKAAYLAVVSAHGSNRPDGVIRHAARAKTAGLQSDLIQELLVRAWSSRQDTAQWEQALWTGISEYPHYSYFFTHLIDRLFETDRLDVGMAVADSLLRLDSSVPIYWYAKSLILSKQHKDEEVISICDSCLVRDSNYVDALYNKGIAALNLAVIHTESACTDLTNPECLRQREVIRGYYLLARDPMERVRRLQPEAVERWAAPLYRIYLNLNMGKEFDEMDELLNGR